MPNEIRNIDLGMEVADDAWASLLPDLLLDIFRRLETTAVIRCAAACKPWRRIIVGNASSLRPCPDRYNPNLLLGFFHRSCSQGETIRQMPPPPAVISLTAVDTGRCERLSSFIPAASAGGVDLSFWHIILSSRDGFLLLRRGSKPDGLCLCNPMAGDCRFLPLAPIRKAPIMEECTYVLLTSYDVSPSAGSSTKRDVNMTTVQVLAMAGTYRLCTEEDRLAYQVFSGDDSAAVWGPVQRSEEVNKGLQMITYGRSPVVCRDGVHCLAGPGGKGNRITSTVGLDVYTGRAWTTELPQQCQFYYHGTTPSVLTTSSNGLLSLLQPLPNHDIQVWVLLFHSHTMEWTMQHRISIHVQNRQLQHYPGDRIFVFKYLNVVCPRSGFLFIMLLNSLQLCIDLKSGVHVPVQCMGQTTRRYQYYPYEMDWPTYISKMKNF